MSRILFDLANGLNFRRTAERLNLSQPPLSRHIQKWAHALRRRLPDHTRRSARLTPDRDRFLTDAMNLLQRAGAAALFARLAEAELPGPVPTNTFDLNAGEILDLFTTQGLSALLQVIGIDLVLAGDNAIVIGLAAAGLPKELRGKAILVGILAATVLRIGFALATARLMHLVGLLLTGGLLLLWVCWKMWRELRANADEAEAIEALTGSDLDNDGQIAEGAPQKSFLQAAIQIVVADVSMSLDNVLAVAGAARAHPTVLAIGLTLSIALMGLAASVMARILRRYPVLAYAGLLIIVYVALRMIWDGWNEVQPVVLSALS